MSAPSNNPEPASAQPATPTPRALLYRTLTLLWLFPSVGALLLLVHDAAWWRAGGFLAGLGAVRLEQWIAIGLLALHGWFAWRWRRCARAS
jgi:hypothetical protein